MSFPIQFMKHICSKSAISFLLCIHESTVECSNNIILDSGIMEVSCQDPVSIPMEVGVVRFGFVDGRK